jgi:Mn2+/Fe2+ NRAMP family transporter
MPKLKNNKTKNFKIENFKNFKNLLNKDPTVIHSVLTASYVSLAVLIIFILFHSFIIYYLVNLKKCLCFQELNDKNYSNINFLIIIESLVLIQFLITFILILILMYSINKKQKGGSTNDNSYFIIGSIIYGVILFLNIYFLYNVKKLSENIKEDCECSHSWIRYLLYIYAINIIFIVISGIIRLFYY